MIFFLRVQHKQRDFPSHVPTDDAILTSSDMSQCANSPVSGPVRSDAAFAAFAASAAWKQDHSLESHNTYMIRQHDVLDC